MVRAHWSYRIMWGSGCPLPIALPLTRYRSRLLLLPELVPGCGEKEAVDHQVVVNHWCASSIADSLSPWQRDRAPAKRTRPRSCQQLDRPSSSDRTKPVITET